jgi:hypothetical protein
MASGPRPENACKMARVTLIGDHFTNCERVRRCTRFVPEGRNAALPAQKKALQRSLKPTPGLEPGTPSLRVKIRQGPESIRVHQSPMVRRVTALSAGPRGTLRSTAVFARCSRASPRALRRRLRSLGERGGLENRYPSLGGSRVRIPPPPLPPGKPLFKRVSRPP